MLSLILVQTILLVPFFVHLSLSSHSISSALLLFFFFFFFCFYNFFFVVVLSSAIYTYVYVDIILYYILFFLFYFFLSVALCTFSCSLYLAFPYGKVHTVFLPFFLLFLVLWFFFFFFFLVFPLVEKGQQPSLFSVTISSTFTLVFLVINYTKNTSKKQKKEPPLTNYNN